MIRRRIFKFSNSLRSFSENAATRKRLNPMKKETKLLQNVKMLEGK